MMSSQGNPCLLTKGDDLREFRQFALRKCGAMGDAVARELAQLFEELTGIRLGPALIQPRGPRKTSFTAVT